ncbi:MAG: DUF1501 domain-containing protein [Deltaproteobacteria bacterium]|nr:DUF1501 domain-containing protein [Deltaproteobacteria bacterium]
MVRKLTRRQVLHGGGAAVLAAGLAPFFGLRRAGASAVRRVLVAIFQRGAVDGLNMVVPHGEPTYYSLRPTIAIQPPGSEGGALDLDGDFGLHPSMSALLPSWQAGELAIVHACGSHDPTRSHFDAQDYMETGLPGDGATEGWLARHLRSSANGGALRAVSLTGSIPRVLAGAVEVYAAPSLTDLTLGRSTEAAIARTALERMYGPRSDLLGVTVRDTLANFDVFSALDREVYRPANGAVYPAGELGTQLREVAQVLKADLGVEVAFLDVEGWDTHANQGGSAGELANRLRNLADALAAFRLDLGESMAEVSVLTMSEFGRTAAENGTRGTDHGHGTAMLLLGGTVRGGRVYGAWPGLRSAELYEGRDLAVTTDFRSLFAEVAVRHLGNPDVASVFPGFAWDPTSRLGVVV